MRPATRRFAFAQLLIVPMLVAWPRAGGVVRLDLQPESKLWVEGTSTVRGYQCRAIALDAVFQSDGRYVTSAILRGEKAITGVDLTIETGQLECGNGTMNDYMRKALKAEAYPAITFRLTTYTLAKVADTLRINLTGDLTIAGTPKTVTLQAVAKAAGEGILLVEGSHELRMTEFGISPLTLMMSTLKVNDRVKVGFKLVITD